MSKREGEMTDLDEATETAANSSAYYFDEVRRVEEDADGTPLEAIVSILLEGNDGWMLTRVFVGQTGGASTIVSTFDKDGSEREPSVMTMGNVAQVVV